jgi:hypothetical protein
MIVVPVREPPVYRIRRLLVRGLVVASGIVVVVCAVAWIAAYQSSVKIDQGRPYVWRSGSAIFLANTWLHDVTCTVTVDHAAPYAVQLPHTRDFAVRGARIARLSAEPAVVTCDDEVTVSSGPVLLLYRLASWSDALPGAVAIPLFIGLHRWRERVSLPRVYPFRRMAGLVGRRRRRLR